MPRVPTNSKGPFVQIKKGALSSGRVPPVVKSHGLVRGALAPSLPGSGLLCNSVHTLLLSSLTPIQKKWVFIQTLESKNTITISKVTEEYLRHPLSQMESKIPLRFVFPGRGRSDDRDLEDLQELLEQSSVSEGVSEIPLFSYPICMTQHSPKWTLTKKMMPLTKIGC